MPDAAGFCSQCGAIVAKGAVPEAAPAKRQMATMLGIAAVGLLPEPERPNAPAAPSPREEHKTMLGVAIPGIAPRRPGAAPPARGDHATMLGVAIPGVAPLHAGRAPQPPKEAPVIVPRPRTLINEPLPEAPRRLTPKGVPLALMAGGVGVLVLLVGVVVVLVWRSAPPLVVQPRLGPENKELLHLTCESCPNGTVATLGVAKGTFQAKECDIDLAAPLKVGENPIEIHLDRPGIGRDEKVKAVVPIAYRIRADLSSISADPPSITVLVETLPGTEVRLEGRPMTLDASGHASQALDIGAETEGPTDESRVIERTVAYAVTPKGGKTERGTVSARVGVAPLHLDAPGTHATIDSPKFFVAGRSLKGAAVTVNGRPLTVNPNGTFAESFETRGVGDTSVTVRAAPPQLAARTVHLKVKQVAHLEAEARSFESLHVLGYDAISSNIAANAGQALVVEGDVLEARTQNHQTVLVVNDRRGCAHTPCVTRVLHGADDALHIGDLVRAYGHVTRAFAGTDGKVVPEVEADFLLRGRRRP